MKTFAFAALAATALLFPACTSTGTAGGPGPYDPITVEEIQATDGVNDAYDLVRRLRPRFLRGRSGTRGTAGATAPRNQVSSAGSTSGVVVYVNDVKIGGVDELRRIAAESIREVTYMRGSDATTRFGTGHGAGVILVTTR